LTTGGRFPELPPEQLSDAQRRVHAAIAGGPRGGVRGPFNALLRSPELADRVQQLGAYLRFGTSLPARLNELAILINARFWGSQYEWYAHRPLALEAGLAASIADDIAAGERPAAMQEDEAVVYDFCTALHARHVVDDGLFARTTGALGDRAVMDLIGVSGYYTLVSMVLNVAEVPLPPGVPAPW
jgi:4-carboxymuconolactone decarboxylase